MVLKPLRHVMSGKMVFSVSCLVSCFVSCCEWCVAANCIMFCVRFCVMLWLLQAATVPAILAVMCFGEKIFTYTGSVPVGFYRIE